MNRFFTVCLFICLACSHVTAWAQEMPLGDPAQEARALKMFQIIRCQVCQGESLDGSRANLAKDMRMLIRRKIERGETDQAIEAWLIDRYGEHILMETPFSSKTFILWGLPLFLLVICILYASTHIKYSLKAR